MSKKITVKEAVDRLVEEFTKDKSGGSYYHSWKANIAMSIYDEYKRKADELNYIDLNKLDINQIANDGAKRFLDLLIHVGDE